MQPKWVGCKEWRACKAVHRMCSVITIRGNKVVYHVCFHANLFAFLLLLTCLHKWNIRNSTFLLLLVLSMSHKYISVSVSLCVRVCVRAHIWFMCVCDYCDALLPPILYLCLVSMPQLVARWVRACGVWRGDDAKKVKAYRSTYGCNLSTSAHVVRRLNSHFFHRDCNMKYLHLNTHAYAVICVYLCITYICMFYYICARMNLYFYFYVSNATNRTWKLHHSPISATALHINKLCGNAHIHIPIYNTSKMRLILLFGF